ncbi:MAG TPA: GDP-mannose 4,6-dehydratase, partial [Longimicrobiales bacterium]|nr:GDP-mannose 4,6-dehydratase [Longimicrobiales bacterium]
MGAYLVTGAAGFIGSKVAEQLLERGDEVVGVDNFNDAYDVRLKHWRIGRLEGQPGFTLVRADIAQMEAMAPLFRKHFDGVINLAARAGVRQSVDNPQVYVDTNVSGTLTLLRLCVEREVPKF